MSPAHATAAFSALTPEQCPQPCSRSEAAWAQSHYSPGKVERKDVRVVTAEAKKEFGCVSSGVNLA